MIRAWQKVRRSFRFIRAGFDQYRYLKANSFRLKQPMIDGREAQKVYISSTVSADLFFFFGRKLFASASYEW